MGLQEFLDALGPEIEDPEEESYHLFTLPLPSQNLGFIDPKASTLSLTISGRDFEISQSPTILNSDRGGGTTGAVVWKITPLFACWLTAPENFLFKHGILDHGSVVLELGCGISGLTALALSPLIKNYILTDQSYVQKLISQNLAQNQADTSSSKQSRKSGAKPKRGSTAKVTENASSGEKIVFQSLDWETDQVTQELAGSQEGLDVLIACDCIYNDTLISPFVQTCVDICRLRSSHIPTHSSKSSRNEGARDSEEKGARPTICIIAQQLRSPEVFEAWLSAFHRSFRVWRVPDKVLIPALRGGEGFVVHVGVLRDAFPPSTTSYTTINK